MPSCKKINNIRPFSLFNKRASYRPIGKGTLNDLFCDLALYKKINLTLQGHPPSYNGRGNTAVVTFPHTFSVRRKSCVTGLTCENMFCNIFRHITVLSSVLNSTVVVEGYWVGSALESKVQKVDSWGKPTGVIAEGSVTLYRWKESMD